MADPKTSGPRGELGPGAKVGVAIASALGIVALFSIGLWLWWRQRQKEEMNMQLPSFVTGDIVNYLDGGRFEKPSNKPAGVYDPYYHGGSSSSSVTPSPVYYHPPANSTVPPLEQPVGSYSLQHLAHHQEQPSTGYNEYYAPFPAPAPAASVPSLPPPRDIQPPEDRAHSIPPPLPPPSISESHAWSNTTRHPWSPPDYDAHSPISDPSVQADTPFQAPSRQADNDHYPVVALPAILPEPRPKPQAELPARDIHGRGTETELPAPEQLPPRRQGPPQGNDIDEQKFLLSDILMLRQEKSKPRMRGGPSG